MKGVARRLGSAREEEAATAEKEQGEWKKRAAASHCLQTACATASPWSRVMIV